MLCPFSPAFPRLVSLIQVERDEKTRNRSYLLISGAMLIQRMTYAIYPAVLITPSALYPYSQVSVLKLYETDINSSI